MKETIYHTTFWKTIKVLALPGFILIAQIGLNIYAYSTSTPDLYGLLILNVPFSIFTIPAIIISINYVLHSKNRKIILKYNTLSMINKGKEITLNSNEIETINIYSMHLGRLPWIFFEYYTFKTKKQSITFNNMTTSISSIWLNTLSGRITCNNINHKTSYYPIMTAHHK